MIVGVLGGGQLGHMLCQAASQVHFHISIWSEALMIVLQFVNLRKDRWDVLTVEIEHVDVATMEMLEQ